MNRFKLQDLKAIDAFPNLSKEYVKTSRKRANKMAGLSFDTSEKNFIHGLNTVRHDHRLGYQTIYKK